MAFVLFIINIPQDSVALAKDGEEEKGDGEENVDAKGGVVDGTSPSPSAETSLKTADESEKSPVVESEGHLSETDVEEDAVPDTQNNEYVAESAEKQSGEITGEAQEPTVKTESNDEEEGSIFVDLLGEDSLKDRLQETLVSLQIDNAVWQTSLQENIVQVSFVEESGLRCEEIITRLSNIGIGRFTNTTLSVFPTSIHLRYEPAPSEEFEVSDKVEANYISREEKEHEFRDSIKSRLVVAQVVESVQSNARLTFDYVMLIFLASWIAALGLGENSSVILVASMLISPLMGPILAGIFGTVVKYDDLRNTGIKSELTGLGICLVFGLFAGFIYGGLGVHGQLLGNSDSWPTPEMASRGVHRSLAVGLLIAIPSGAGVALSILGGNAGSLVGVAISASLLPPAVNAGMLWALSITAAISPPALSQVDTPPAMMYTTNISSHVNGTIYPGPSTTCVPFLYNKYTPTYSCNMAEEAAILGTMSLLLTLMNIVAIFLVGLLVLKMKEVAPHTSPSSTEYFFRNDLKIARESYQTTKGKESVTLAKKFLEEYKKVKMAGIAEEEEEEEDAKTLDFKKVLEEVENSPEVKKVVGLVAAPGLPLPFSAHLKDDFTAAEGKISRNEEDHYKTLTEPPEEADPCARVYRTFHACDLPLKLKSTQPLTPQPRTRQLFLNGKQLRKHHSDMYIVNSRPASKRIPKYKKRQKKKLKLHIPEQTAEFSKVDTKKPRFEVQIIEEGKPTRSDSPVYDPQYTPTEESNPLIK
ncbi:uncharacterized protein [Haliotis cracherodii]|uniref:uncharacterized protein n=1 Tax=Haliotis cracherodii TaxID=6455 RepID=UPI0039E9F00E